MRPTGDRRADIDLSDVVNGPIEIVGCHAAGEIGDVIVGGVAVPPGANVWEQSRWVAADGRLRDLVLNEPRGGVFRHVNLLVPATDPTADVGFVIMEPADTPPMSGSNAICVATVVLETGIVEMDEPTTVVRLQAPGGVVEATAECRDGSVVSVSIRNIASFVAQRDVELDVDGLGRVRVDTAFGGDSFVMVDAADLGVEIRPDRARHLAELGSRITRAANEQLGFVHPAADWSHISFCQIAGPLERRADGALTMRNTVVVEPGKLDRSPTGTGVSARLALLRDRGTAEVGDRLVMTSVIGSEFVGRIEADITVGDGAGARAGIIPVITGRAWRYGRFRYETHPDDPWPLGYRVGDTWPTR